MQAHLRAAYGRAHAANDRRSASQGIAGFNKGFDHFLDYKPAALCARISDPGSALSISDGLRRPTPVALQPLQGARTLHSAFRTVQRRFLFRKGRPGPLQSHFQHLQEAVASSTSVVFAPPSTQNNMQSAALRTSAALSGQCQAIFASRSLRAARPPLCALPAIPRAVAPVPTYRCGEPSTSASVFSTAFDGRSLAANEWGVNSGGGLLNQAKVVKRSVATAAQATSVAAPAAGSEQAAVEVSIVL